MERMGRDELPDNVDRSFLSPLVVELRRLRAAGSRQEQTILNRMIREIRYQVEPQASGTYVARLFFCFTKDCTSMSSPTRGQAESVLGALVTTFAARAIDLAVLPPVFAAETLEEMNAADYRDSNQLRWALA